MMWLRLVMVLVVYSVARCIHGGILNIQNSCTMWLGDEVHTFVYWKDLTPSASVKRLSQLYVLLLCSALIG